jgi:LysR family transcriptional regulator, regulator of abg operon
MTLEQIAHFLAMVEHGSLRAAARHTGISQPAMSKSLRQLEAGLHARLLRRMARGVELTAAGRTFVTRARVVQSELRKARDELAAQIGGSKGAVALGVAPATSSSLVPAALRHFRQDWPEARVRILEGVRTHLLPMVREESLDFAVAQSMPGQMDPGLRFRPLLRPRLVVTCRKGHPKAGARSLAELVDASWLVFYAPGTGGALERSFASARLPAPNALVHCESYATALALLARSDLLGLIAQSSLSEDPVAIGLRRISVAEVIAAPTIGIFSRRDAPLPPAAEGMYKAFSTTAALLAAAR